MRIPFKMILSLVIVILLASCDTNENITERVLPILGEKDVVYKMVDGKELADTIYHLVPAFKYINQDSILVESKDIRSKVWVADFFFSHCPSICPPMTAQMKRLNEETADISDHIQFLSFSIDPDRDNPKRLREYMDEYGIEAKNWHFFTGDEDATHELAKSFFNGAERDEDAAGGFGHTDYFAIVDTENHIRGIYRGTDPVQVDSLQNDLRKLLEHEYGITRSK